MNKMENKPICLFTNQEYLYSYGTIGIMVRVFANGPRDRGSIPVRVIPKTHKIVLDAFLFNTQHYKVQIMGK